MYGVEGFFPPPQMYVHPEHRDTQREEDMTSHTERMPHKARQRSERGIYKPRKAKDARQAPKPGRGEQGSCPRPIGESTALPMT